MVNSTITSRCSSSKKVVQVFECPPAFPGAGSHGRNGTSYINNNKRATSTTTKDNVPARNNKKHKPNSIDFHEAAREVRELVSSTLVGHQRQLHLEDKYTEITGLKKKRQKCPVKILWGIQKKQAQRKARAEEEAKAAGIVTPKDTMARKREKERLRTQARLKNRSMFGPIPSVGHMDKGILHVNNKKRPH
jgi:hypothetical protein